MFNSLLSRKCENCNGNNPTQKLVDEEFEYFYVCGNCFPQYHPCSLCPAWSKTLSRCEDSSDSYLYCKNCITSFKPCKLCSKVTRNLYELATSQSHEDGTRGDFVMVCSDCYGISQGCDHCNDKFASNVVLRVASSCRCDLNIVNLCDYCFDRNQRELVRLEQRARKVIVYDWDTNPMKILTIRPQEGKLNLGFEIETEISDPHDYNEMLEIFYSRAASRAIAKADGSIENGFEMVSAPMLLTDIEWLVDDLFVDDKLHDSANTDADNVGMHVHVSKNVLNRSQMAKMILFTQAKGNDAFMDFIAQRELSGHEYCSNTGRASWKDVIHPLREFGTRGYKPSKFVKAFRKNLREDVLNSETDRQKYSALNFNKVNTVEFRIFQASQHRQTVKANLEFCAALVEFCDQASRPITHYGAPRFFIEFIHKRKEYRNLAARCANAESVHNFQSTIVDLRSIRQSLDDEYYNRAGGYGHY